MEGFPEGKRPREQSDGEEEPKRRSQSSEPAPSHLVALASGSKLEQVFATGSRTGIFNFWYLPSYPPSLFRRLAEFLQSVSSGHPLNEKIELNFGPGTVDPSETFEDVFSASCHRVQKLSFCLSVPDVAPYVHLNRMLRISTSLTALSFYDICLSPSQSAALADCYSSASLRNVSITYAQFPPHAFRFFTSSLITNSPNLQTLSLSQTNPSSNDFASLGQSIVQQGHLDTLDASECASVDCAAVVAFSKFLPFMTSLRHLNLSMSSSIREEGFKALFSSLAWNTSLTSLNLSYSGLATSDMYDPHGSDYSSDDYPDNYISESDISGSEHEEEQCDEVNSPGEDAPLDEFFRLEQTSPAFFSGSEAGHSYNSTLTHLDLGFNRFQPQRAYWIIEILSRFTAVTTLKISQTHLRNIGTTKLFEQLHRFPSLSQIEIDETFLSNRYSASLPTLLAQNPNITSLGENRRWSRKSQKRVDRRMDAVIERHLHNMTMRTCSLFQLLHPLLQTVYC